MPVPDDPLVLLRAFAKFLGLAVSEADRFACARPELFDVASPEAPPRSPATELDPEVEDQINKGEL